MKNKTTWIVLGITLFCFCCACVGVTLAGLWIFPVRSDNGAQNPVDTGQKNNETNGSFFLDDVNKVPPAEILEEIAFFGTGGDVSCEPDSNLSIFGSEKVEAYEKALVHACGWEMNERIALQIREPDGNIKNDEIVARAYYEGQSDPTVRFYLYFTQEGKHVVTLTGNSGSLSISVQVSRPSDPRMYMVEERQIVFYNLQPSETISLYAYRPNRPTSKVKFVGWKRYQADQDGGLVIAIDDPSLFYYAMGEVSGYLEDKNLIGVGITGTIFK